MPLLHLCACMQSAEMPVEQWQYNDGLAEACGVDVSKPDDWRRRVYALMSQRIFERPETFRDEHDEECDRLVAEANLRADVAVVHLQRA